MQVVFDCALLILRTMQTSPAPASTSVWAAALLGRQGTRGKFEAGLVRASGQETLGLTGGWITGEPCQMQLSSVRAGLARSSGSVDHSLTPFTALASSREANLAVGPEEFHLLGFEKQLLSKGERVQLGRLQAAYPDRPKDNERVAFARGLIACAAAWGLVGIPFFGVALALQLTVGWWCLLGWAGVVACVGMNRWRSRQSKRLLAVETR